MALRTIHGTAHIGGDVWEIRGGFDSWGDGKGTPTEYPPGTPITRRDWTDNFDRLRAGSVFAAVGQGGYTIQQITAEAADAIAAAPTATVSILSAGWNNITEGDNEATLWARYSAWMTAFDTARYIICTIPPPFRLSGNEEAIRQKINYRLLSGELGSTVDIVDLEDIFYNAADPYYWNPAYQDISADTGLVNGHPNEIASAKLYEAIYKILVLGWTADVNRKMVGAWATSSAANLTATTGYAYSAPRAASEIITAGGSDLEFYSIGVFSRSANAGGTDVIKLGIYEINPTTKAIGIPVARFERAQQSANTYKWCHIGGLSVRLESGKSYTVVAEHEGSSPRIVYVGSQPATTSERSAIDNAGISANAFVENSRTGAPCAIWGLVRTVAVDIPLPVIHVPSTLEVIDSYLSLDSTQYAQAPIGATRLATKGNGTNLYGTIPTWTASNWEIEFDVVFPTTLLNLDKTIFDSGVDGANRVTFYVAYTSNFMRTIGANAVFYMDGMAITENTVVYPVDGAVHHIKITGTTFKAVGTLLRRYTDIQYFTGSLFNLRLTDLDNSANSRFYPMDETIATATFIDTSVNAANGTWFNRVSGNVVTVYPGAIKPSEGFWIACKFRLPVVEASRFIMGVGSFVTGGSSVVLRTDSSKRLIAVRYNGTTAINTATRVQTLLDGQEYIAVVKVNSDGSMTVYLDSLAATGSVSAGTAFQTVLDWINLNGAKGTVGAASTKTAPDIYYAYLYNGTPSNDYINALMAGENPMYVGDIRQGYNLLGDGDEVNGGPALTLYGAFDGEQWHVPSFVTHRGTRKVVSSPVRSPIRSVVRSPIN